MAELFKSLPFYLPYIVTNGVGILCEVLARKEILQNYLILIIIAFHLPQFNWDPPSVDFV